MGGWERDKALSLGLATDAGLKLSYENTRLVSASRRRGEHSMIPDEGKD